jgi:hypothetical protein
MRFVAVDVMLESDVIVALGFGFAQMPEKKEQAWSTLRTTFAAQQDTLGGVSLIRDASGLNIIAILAKPTRDAKAIAGLVAAVATEAGFSAQMSTRLEPGTTAWLREQAAKEPQERDIAVRPQAVVIIMPVRVPDNSKQLSAVGLDFTWAPPGATAEFIREFRRAISDNTTGLEPLRIAVAQDTTLRDIAIWFDNPLGVDMEMVVTVLRVIITTRMNMKTTFTTAIPGSEEAGSAKQFPVVHEATPIQLA